MTIKDGIKFGFGLCAGRLLWEIAGDVIGIVVAASIIETDFAGKESRTRRNAETYIKEHMPEAYSEFVDRGRIRVVKEIARRKIGF